MLHINLFFVFSLSCFSTILLPTQSTTQNEKPHKPIKITPFYEVDIPENIDFTPLKQHPEQIKKTDIFTEEDIEEMELVFESSPEKAQDIVKYLQDPTYFPCNIDFRSAFFVGEPGSGKTITAKAIAYKMAQEGWEHKIISSRSVLKKSKYKTAIALRDTLEIAISSKQPTIIIINDLNVLLKNSDILTAVLCDFLDKHQHNINFFFIGTMNSATKVPKRFKSRMLCDYISFTND